MTKKLLLVDDDVELTRLLSELLAGEGFVVDTHAEGTGAVARALAGGYSLVMLDIMLPGVSGLDVLRHIRARSTLPIILLTARGDDTDRVIGLEAGADDYVPKPFNARELAARIRAVLRRSKPDLHEERQGMFRINDVVLDSAARSVRRRGILIPLTTVEFEMLRELMVAAGRTVSREALAQTVLGRQRFDALDRSVDMHISKIRRKLGSRAGGEPLIRTVRGLGYQYVIVHEVEIHEASR